MSVPSLFGCKILDENDTGKTPRENPSPGRILFSRENPSPRENPSLRLYLDVRFWMKMILGKFGGRSVFICMMIDDDDR